MVNMGFLCGAVLYYRTMYCGEITAMGECLQKETCVYNRQHKNWLEKILSGYKIIMLERTF